MSHTSPSLHAGVRQTHAIYGQATQTLLIKVADFKDKDTLEQELTIERWHNFMCPDLASMSPNTVTLRVPELADGWQARKYLYRELRQMVDGIPLLLSFGELFPIKLSVCCAFTREGELSLLGCVSKELSKEFLSQLKSQRMAGWSDFIRQSTLYRLPFQCLQQI